MLPSYCNAVDDSMLQDTMNAGIVFICLQLSLIMCSTKPAGECTTVYTVHLSNSIDEDVAESQVHVKASSATRLRSPST